MARTNPDNNPLAMSLYELERMIAVSPTWQGLVNTTSWTVARDAIAFVDDSADPGQLPRPACVILGPSTLEYSQVAELGPGALRPSGELLIYLAVDVPAGMLLVTGANTADQMPIRKQQLQYMSNVFGDFMQDLANASGVDQAVDTAYPDSQLGAPKIIMRDMARTPERLWQTAGQFWYLILSVHWGDS